MESSEGQLALIKVWADGTDFEVDSTMSPKANFGGLAKAKGWVGADAEWCSHWEACFNQPYLFGRQGEQFVIQCQINNRHDLVLTSACSALSYSRLGDPLSSPLLQQLRQLCCIR
jgi:hypothetical protein